MLSRLRVNHRENPRHIPWDQVNFSFWADKGETFTVRVLEQGSVIWEKPITEDERIGFYPDVNWKPAADYTWTVTNESGETATGSFTTADTLDAPIITPAADYAHPEISKGFSVNGPIKQARLMITGLGLYRAYLNERRVGDAYLTPGCNDYENYLRYQTYDVTELLEAGDNRIAVILGNGWALGRFGLENKTHIYGDRPVLCARLVVEYEDGTVTELRTDESWTARPSAILDSGIYDGEVRDDTFHAAEACPCKVIEMNYPLTPDFSVPVTVKERLKPTLYVSPKGEQILDFGQEVTGVVSFRCREKVGTKITLKHGEVLQNGCFYNENLRTAKAEFVYISDSVEKDVEPMFTFMGFRYVLVEGMESVDPADFTALVFYSDLPGTLGFSTDNGNLNKLTRNTLWGQRGNFVDVPTDCPQRDERLGWTGDTQVFSTTAMYHMDCWSFYRKALRDLRWEQTRYYGGELPMFCPSLKGALGPGGAVWSDVGVIVPWNLYMAYGDETLLAEHYPLMRDYAETLIRADQTQGGEHILREGFSFGDWLALDGVTAQARFGGTDETFIRTVYYRNTLLLVSKAAGELGRTEEQARYETMAEDIRAALRRAYFSQTGRFCLDTQTAYLLALHYDIAPDRAQTAAQFYDKLKRSRFLLQTGFTGTPLLIGTLFASGMDEAAYRILFYEGYPGWMYAVRMGATTIWERWNSVMPDGTCSGTGMNSLNHYANGAVCEAVYQYIGGLRCAAPGWKQAVVEPRPSFYVRRSRIAFDAPVGRYEVAWSADGTAFEMTVTVPHGGSATVRLPGTDQAETQVGPGEHHFSCQADRDLTAQFGPDPVVLDVLRDERGCEIVQRTAPALYETLTDLDPEFQVLRFSELDRMTKLLGTPCDLEKLLWEIQTVCN